MGILKESTNDVNRNKHTHEAIGLFKNGDIIQCDVVSVNSKDQIIIIEWKNDEQIEKIYSRKFDKGIQVKNKLTNIEKPVVENILDKNSDNTENKNNSETNAQVVPFKIKYIGAKSGKKNRNRKVKKVHFEQNFEEKYLSNYKNPYISEIESKLYGISNFVKSETFDKLRLIGQTVPVEIQCKYDASGKAKNKYFVDGKYNANLLITNYNHIISNIDKSIIEKNFQNGDEIHGEVLSIENDTFLVKWIISDTDLNRFLAENIPISTK
jgi:exosome complex RNA-binding protein Csl4